MNANKVLCEKNNVTYGDIRIAMAEGAQNIEDIKEMTAACCEEDCCKKDIEMALNMICNCNRVTRAKILEVIKKGAKTVDKIGQYTAAGTSCGKCKVIISKMIEKNS